MAEFKMTEAEHRHHAVRILGELIDDCDYSNVYEDEELADATEADWQQVHNLVTTARFTIRPFGVAYTPALGA